MNDRGRYAALAGVTILLATGCEDPAARQRADLQAAIDEASAAMRSATFITPGPADDQFDAVRGQLQGVLTTLQQVDGGELGQEAAKAQLQAAAHAELAAMDLATAQMIESEQQGELMLMHGRIDALSRMRSLADAQSSYTTEAERQQLDAARGQAESELSGYQERIASLDEPISERTLANNSDARDVEDLRAEADALQREASAAGHADGYPDYQRAVELQRRADLIEYEIAQREIELALDLQPEHSLADARAGQYVAMIDTIDSTGAQLEQLQQEFADRSGDTTEAARALEGEIQSQLETLDSVQTGELDDLYDEAIGHLEQALRLAGAAASKIRGEEGATAQLQAARTAETLGRLHSERASRLAAYRDALQRLISVADDDAADLRQQVGAISGRITEQQQQATEAFQEASDRLDQVQSRTLQTELARMRQELAALAGRPAEIAPMPAPTATGGDGGAPAAAPAPAASGSGFATAQALVDHLGGLDWSVPDSVLEMFDMVQAQDTISRGLIDAQVGVITSLEDLNNAVGAQFGAASAAQFRQSVTAIFSASAITAPSLTAVTDDRATMSFTTPAQPQPQTLDLVRVGGSWMIDGASLVSLLTEVQNQQVDPSKLIAATNQMAAGLDDIAARVRAGELSDVTALQPEIMKAMMGPMTELMQNPSP